MGRQKKKGSSKKKNSIHRSGKSDGRKRCVTAATSPPEWNFLLEAGKGCYIARRDDSPDWLLEWEDVDPEEFRKDDAENDEPVVDEVPDIAVDVEEQTLSVCNIDNYTKVAYVTVYETKIIGADGRALTPGSTINNEGTENSCITFIVLCPPCVFVHLCHLDVPPDMDITSLRIESDVSRWNQHPNPNDEHTFRIGFPLGKVPLTPPSPVATHVETKAFLCTQGEGGELTHFFSGNLHAIDFRSPVGTELLAVADGIVVDAKDHNTLTGIAVTNLFEWNSILLQICCPPKGSRENDLLLNEAAASMERQQHTERILEHPDGPLFVEYVHIQKSFVQPGDFVQKGQIIGSSGSVGFSPEPHLHFSAFRSSNPTAPTVRVLFDGVLGPTFQEENSPCNGKPFLPAAGLFYNAQGMVQ